MDGMLFSTCISDLTIDVDFVLWDTRHTEKNLNVTRTLTLGQQQQADRGGWSLVGTLAKILIGQLF